MITLIHYFGKWAGYPDVTDQVEDHAVELLMRVNSLLNEAYDQNIPERVNPTTLSCISGENYGGFRPQVCKIGAPKSAHKTGEAVDVYDPGNLLDLWLDKFDSNGGANNSMLEKHGLYREIGSATNGWCHLSIRKPNSGRRSFAP